MNLIDLIAVNGQTVLGMALVLILVLILIWIWANERACEVRKARRVGRWNFGSRKGGFRNQNW